MTPPNGNISLLLALVRVIHRSPCEFPAQRPMTRGFAVFFDLRLNKRLVNNPKAGDLRHYRGHYDVTAMFAHN